MNSDLFRTILEGREWSWSVFGCVVMITGLLIRSLLLRNILRGMKVRDANWYRRMLFYYEKKSILGWLFFAVSIAGAMLFWRFESFFLKYLNTVEWILVFFIFYIISLFLHIRAYASAIVETVSENISGDKDL
jgi:hypothetical protein